MRVRERYELAGELRDRYAAAGRLERSEILTGFCLATRYERKHAIKVLRGRERKPISRLGRHRHRRYGLEFRQALKVCWEASGYICSQRLQPFLPDLLPLLQRHGHLPREAGLERLVLSASIATVERTLVQLRRGVVARTMSQTKPGTLLRRQIPVVVGQRRKLDQPGYLEIDLVSHSGEVAAGEWIHTLCATDLSTGWTERVLVMGKGEHGIVVAIERIREQLPFPLLGLHPDSGSEFLNWHLFGYCQTRGIAFSRSRPDHKNDNAHVEQKNWTLPDRVSAPRHAGAAGLAGPPVPRPAPPLQQLLSATAFSP